MRVGSLSPLPMKEWGEKLNIKWNNVYIGREKTLNMENNITTGGEGQTWGIMSVFYSYVQSSFFHFCPEGNLRTPSIISNFRSA